MKIIKKIKSNKGVSLVDIGVAIIIIMLLGATIANMFYQIYYNVSMIRLNATAVNYAVNILEDIDRLAYEDVDNDLLISNDYDLASMFEASIDVEKYIENNPEKEDIIKIVTLTIKYKMSGDSEEITFKKLKIKEM